MDYDTYFMKLTALTSEKSPCDRLKVGCILVKNKRIVSQGYNGFLSGCPHESIVRNNHEQAIVHAEQNAISYCARYGTNCDGCTAYITHYPCIICCRILLAAGIKKIIFEKDYKNDILVSKLCKQANVDIIKYIMK